MKNFIHAKAINTLTVVFVTVFLLLAGLSKVNAQCAYGGTSFCAQNVSGLAHNTWAGCTNFYGGEYMLISGVMEGDMLGLYTCGTSYDTQVTLFREGDGTSRAYNDDNGPYCTGTTASILYKTAGSNAGGVSGANLANGQWRALMNLYNCTTNVTNGTLYVLKYPIGIGVESTPTFTAASACNNGTARMGAGAYYDITVAANTYYDWTWNNNGSAQVNGFYLQPLNGSGAAVGQNTSTLGWNSGTTTSVRIHGYRVASLWSGTSGILTYRHSQPVSVTATASNTNPCHNTAAVVSLTGAGTYVNAWSWTGGPAGGTIASSTAQSTTWTSPNDLTGPSGTFTLSASNNGCATAANTASVAVRSNNPGAVTITTPVCAGLNPLTIANSTAATSNGGTVSYTYYYRGGPSALGWTSYETVTSSSSNLPSTVYNTPGSWFIARNSDFGCGQANNVTTIDIPLTVVADPALSAATLTNSTICLGGTTDATSNLTGGTGTQTPVWEYSANNSTFSTVANGTPTGAVYTNTGTATMTIASISAAGTYYYRRNLPATGLGCNATGVSVAHTVAVDPTWATNSFAPASGNAICAGGTVVFSATVNGAQGGTVTWVRSTTAGGSGTTVTSPDAPPSTGTYYYRPQYTPGSNGCNLADGTESNVVVNGLTTAPTLNTATPASNGQIYVQNFDATLSSTSTVTWTDNSTIPGWYAASTNLGANGLVIGTGSSNVGNLNNYGSSSATDRTIGSLASASTGTLRYGVKLTNSTGGTVDKIYVQYTGEQWRAGGGTATSNALTLDYSVDPSATITTGTYNTTSGLSFTSPITPGTAGALDGNNSSNRTKITGIISLGSSLANGSSVWLRWTDLDETGFDHGLGLDDLTVVLYSSTGTQICAGYNGPSATFNAGSGGSTGAADSYEKSIDNGLTWSSYTSGAIDATGATGSVQVRGTRSPGSYGCMAAGPNVLAFWPIAASPVSPVLASQSPASGNTICAGYNTGTATITAGSGGTGSADDVQISIDGGSTYPVTGYTSGSAIITTGGTGSVWIRMQRTAGTYGCSATGYTATKLWDFSSATVNPTLNTATPAAGTGICAGFNGPNATIVAGSGGSAGAADTYEYSIDNGGSWNSYTSGATIDATGATGSVKVRASRSAGSYGCSGTGPVVLVTWPINSTTVNPTLNTATPSNGTTICQGTSPNATVVAGSGGSAGATDTYEFSIDNGASWSAYTSGASITTTAAVGSVKVRTSRSAGSYGCVATGPTVIARWPVDEMPIPNAGPDQVVCGGYTTTLAGNAAPSGGSGVWTYDPGNPSSTAFITANNPTATALASVYGAHIYYWTLSNGVCPDHTDDVTISYSSPIIASAVVDNCAFTGADKDIILVTATGGTGTLSYTSSNVLDAQLPNIDNNTQPFEAPTDGITRFYTVTDVGGCNSDTSNVITFTDHPTDIPSATTTGLNCYSKMLNKWLTFRDSNNDALLSIKDNNQNLGLVTVNLYVEGSEPAILNSSGHSGVGPTNGNCYLYPEQAMKRHFAITTQNAFASAVDVRLYFSDAELASLISSSTTPPVNPQDGCADDDDVHNINELYVTKYSGVNVDGDYTNNAADAQGGIYRLFGANVTAPNTAFDMVSNGGFSSLYSGGASHHYLQMHVTEFSEFWLHGSSHISPLPVDMIYFEANAVNNTYIQLKWATSLEINNDGFKVERSVDGQTWSQIGWVEGFDNSTVQHDYNYNDVNVVAGTRYYYRLKQMDNDGQFKYTDVVTAIINGEITFSVKDFVPNPTNAATSLIVTAVTQQEITVAFYNVIGEKVSSAVHQLIKGGNLIEFDLSRFASGTYTAVVSSANEVYTKKLVLTK